MARHTTATSLTLPVFSSLPPGAISLGNLAYFSPMMRDLAGEAFCPRKGTDPLLALATGLSWAQTLRARCFGKTKLPDPAWAILLNAYIVELQGSRSSITSLTFGSNFPRSTSQRWVRSLIDDGSLISEPDPNDKRRVWCRLHYSVREDIEQYLYKLANAPRFQSGIKACLGTQNSALEKGQNWVKLECSTTSPFVSWQGADLHSADSVNMQACAGRYGPDTLKGLTMKDVNVSEIAALDLEAGMLVNEREEGVICHLTAAIAGIIGVIF